MKKVLITGASGFLGSHLTREMYRQGYEVRVLVRQGANLAAITDVPCEVFYGCIDVQADVLEAVAGCDVVVHTASLTGQYGISFETYEQVNVTATRYVVEACLQHQTERLVYVSTANTLAPGSKLEPGTELNGFTLFKANSGYINSKYLAQQYVLEQVARRGLPAVVLNPTFMIGPQDLKPSSGQLVLHGLNRRLVLYPPGGKNFVHVRDVCRGVMNAIDKGRPGDCYLLAGSNMSYKEFFSMVTRVSGRPVVLLQIPGVILRLGGLLGSLLERLTRRPQRLTQTTAYLLCLDNYYSGRKSERELALHYQPAEEMVNEAVTWFRQNGYTKA